MVGVGEECCKKGNVGEIYEENEVVTYEEMGVSERKTHLVKRFG